MEALEYRTVDKSNWGNGPWQNEPDKCQWRDEATGLPCLIVRGPSGALCGYVGVSEGHPAFGKDYDSVAADVHGGLTFAGGYNRLGTYILKIEAGISLDAAGWKLIAETPGRSWSVPSRPRVDMHPLQPRLLYEAPPLRHDGDG